MTSLILEVYDAFKSVGVDDDTARKAAGALSSHEREIGELRFEMNARFDRMQAEINGRFAEVDGRFDRMQAEMDSRFDRIQAEMNSRFADVDSRFDRLQAEMNNRFDRMQAEMNSRFDQMNLGYEKRFGRLEAEQLVVRALFAILIAGVASLVVKAFF